jgi:hypothetical protein
MTQPLPRSTAAIELLERLQARDGRRSGDVRQPENDARVLHEIAARQLLEESDDPLAFACQPTYEAQVEERAQTLERFYERPDGDSWSCHERPDHRVSLGELVTRVEKGVARLRLSIGRRPVVGTLPTRSINAQAIAGPPGEGHLIVFDSGIFNFSSILGKVIAQALDVTGTDDGGSLRFDPDAMRQPGQRSLLILRQFADLLFSQVVLGSCAYAEVVPVPPPYVPFSEQLTSAIDTFTLAHEYGHVILGHCGVHEDGAGSYEQELAADTSGFQIATAAWKGHLWSYLGASALFSGYDAILRASNTFLTGSMEAGPSSTHPAGTARRAALSAELPRGSTEIGLGDAIEYALERMTTFLLRAFGKAHRDGFPPAGYRPSSEIEKMAALDAFLNTGFAPD